jgi:hypothetical protein
MDSELPPMVLIWEAWARNHWPVAWAIIYILAFALWKGLEALLQILKLRHEQKELTFKHQELELKLREAAQRESEQKQKQEGQAPKPDAPLIQAATGTQVSRFAGGGSYQRGYTKIRLRSQYDGGFNAPPGGLPSMNRSTRTWSYSSSSAHGIRYWLSLLPGWLLLASILVLIIYGIWHLAVLAVHLVGRLWH